MPSTSLQYKEIISRDSLGEFSISPYGMIGADAVTAEHMNISCVGTIAFAI